MRNLLRDKINTIAKTTPNEILLLVDGFDVFFLAKKDEIIHKFLLYKKKFEFLQLQHIMKDILIFSSKVLKKQGYN